MALLSGAGVEAVSVRPVPKSWVEMRDGVRIDRLGPQEKVSSPDFPVDSSFSIGISVGSVGAPAPGTNLFPNTVTANVVADPGDAAGETLCVAYRYEASAGGAVTTAPGSFAAGVGGSTGFVADASVAPASITSPTPVTLIVTPTVGPVRTVLAEPALILASTGTPAPLSVQRRGTFLVAAGDVITLDVELGGAVRAEPPAGAVNANASARLRIVGNCTTPAVPTLSGIATGFLALLLAAVTAGGLRRQRAKAGG